MKRITDIIFVGVVIVAIIAGVIDDNEYSCRYNDLF